VEDARGERGGMAGVDIWSPEHVGVSRQRPPTRALRNGKCAADPQARDSRQDARSMLSNEPEQVYRRHACTTERSDSRFGRQVIFSKQWLVVPGDLDANRLHLHQVQGELAAVTIVRLRCRVGR